MKKNQILVILLYLLTSSVQAQPEKGTIEFRGSGHWTKIKSEGELRYIDYNLDTEVSYYIIRYISAGTNFNFMGRKDFSLSNHQWSHGFYLAPTLEAYFINRKKIGLSLKGRLNILASSTDNWFENDKRIPSYMYGPKVSWNISPDLNTWLWAAYRKMADYDHPPGIITVFPSDNFDLRWGFSYFLHHKER